MAKKKPAPKRGASRYQAPAKKPVPGWVWLAIGLVIGGFVVFLNQLEPLWSAEKMAADHVALVRGLERDGPAVLRAGRTRGLPRACSRKNRGSCIHPTTAAVGMRMGPG